jgi:UDP-N-acetylmuramoyl-L-alanyl-D-glutamate--2,6-diaminopimelate ligase
MKALIKKIVPKGALQNYHKFLAVFSAFVYGRPSEKMVVIGVTGTNGKSTTVSLISKGLEGAGLNVGSTSTVGFKVADKEWLNNKKMTMLGRFQLQKLLKQMVSAGCKYAIIEVSSEGIKQFRHLGINFDYTVFTNLTPEHIESHGGFENYKRAKGELFKHLTKRKNKNIDDRKGIKKSIVVNLDDEHASYYLNNKADQYFTFSIDKASDFQARDFNVSASGTEFVVNKSQVNLKLIGKFNIYNALPTLIIAQAEGLDLAKVVEGLESIVVVPGRMESINEGQDFSIIVDYAPEPASMEKLYETVGLFEKNKVIHVLGSCGGGRDKARRPILGRMAGEYADYVIITNEDPYDDDPMGIIENVAIGAVEKGKIVDENLFKILDRKEAIQKAINLAKIGDLVLITGKGSEQAMAVSGGKYVAWDDRSVVRELLNSKK